MRSAGLLLCLVLALGAGYFIYQKSIGGASARPTLSIDQSMQVTQR